MDVVKEVQEFKGECASDYKTRVDYILNWSAFEKDYFASWIDGCSDYPMLCEIRNMCDRIDGMITMWERAVENGWIDAEDGWNEDAESYWAYDAMDNKWYLWSNTDDEVQIAEVGQDEDGTYYWIEIENTTGVGDFATANRAMADADHYFDKQAAEAIYQARKNIG
jgi:hypothetical protein